MKPSFEEWTEPHEEDNHEPTRRRVHRKGVGILEMEYYQDDEMIMYCPHCKAAGFSVKLGPKILMPNETRQPDYESWLQCPSCAEIVAAYVVEHDATIIRDDIPTVDNPFENTTEIMGIMGAVAKRHTIADKRATAKRNKERYRSHHYKDKEIDEEMRRHGDRVNLVFDSGP